MALFKLLVSQANRQCLTKPTSSSSHFPLFQFSRTLCSSSSPSSQPSEPKTPSPPPPPRQTIPIQTVAYPAKPKDPSSDSPSEQTSSPQPLPRNPSPAGPVPYESRTWTREDIRYVKDMPDIAPISYPSRVAPLPEDKRREEGKVDVERGDGELDTERRRIEAEYRDREMMRRVLNAEVEKLPFPTLIKEDDSTKKKKVFYDLKEAIHLVKANAKRNFDESLEVHIRLTPDLRRTDLKLNGFVRLPHGPTKPIRVAAFAEGAAADEARQAGADIVGGPEFISAISNKSVKVDFDYCIATHNIMTQMRKLAARLRTRMPTPKDGNITNEIGRAVREIKDQCVLFRKDKTAIVHGVLGKVSFTEEALRENVAAFLNAILLAKPAGLKKSSKYAGYVESVHICSTMGKSFPVTIQSLSMAVDRYNRVQRA